MNCIKKAQPDDYLKQVFNLIKDFGVPESCFIFDPTIFRGLDYYTGPIFETYVEEPKIGSITGGGRYDNLISLLGGPDISAVGTTIGLDRIVDCIMELNLLPNLPKTKTKVLIANFGPETLKIVNNSLSSFSQNKSPLLFIPTPTSSANNLNTPPTKVSPLSPSSDPMRLKKNLVTLKDMTIGEQKTLSLKDLLAQLV